MGFVIDASLTLAWCFEDEADARADRALDLLRQDRAHVPAIWVLEVGNVLLVAERRGRLTGAQSGRFIELLTLLPIHVEPLDTTRCWGAVSSLARLYNLSAYEAAYLELAARLGLPLAAADNRLRTAALAAGVPVLD
jgi:predicted nucleic acid-binding protein